MDVVGEAEDAESLLRKVSLARPGVCVVDIRMPPTHTDEGLVAAQRIREGHPEVGVLVLSQYVEPSYACGCSRSFPRSSAICSRSASSTSPCSWTALRRIDDGETVVDPTIVSRLLGRQRRQDPLAELTPREREVLALVAEGLSNRAIAERLFVTERTVEAHTKQVFLKLGLREDPSTHRRILAVLAFLRS